MLVAFGMIGTSLSGVTVRTQRSRQRQFLLFSDRTRLPVGLSRDRLCITLAIKMNLTSIYTYLEKRFGINAHKAGAFFLSSPELLVPPPAYTW